MTTFARWIGVELDEVSAKEKLVSAAGGFVAIAALMLITHDVLDLDGASMVVASMGASAVLLFAVPHGQLSQPWPVVGGHVTSALIGVVSAKTIGSVELAAAVADQIGASIRATSVQPSEPRPVGQGDVTSHGTLDGPGRSDDRNATSDRRWREGNSFLSWRERSTAGSETVRPSRRPQPGTGGGSPPCRAPRGSATGSAVTTGVVPGTSCAENDGTRGGRPRVRTWS